MENNHVISIRVFPMFCLAGGGGKIGCRATMRIRKRKKKSKQRRDGLQIRTIAGTRRGVFYTKSTLAEQRVVLRQWERTRCQLQLNRNMLAGEELCAVTATDKHTGMWEAGGVCHKDGLAGEQRPGESNWTRIDVHVMHTHMNTFPKWEHTQGLPSIQLPTGAFFFLALIVSYQHGKWKQINSSL